jgi:hypothetical protein
LLSDLHSGFVDALLDRAEFPLHLLDICACIGECRAKAVDISMESGHVAAQSPLLPLEKLNLLRIDASRQKRADRKYCASEKYL